MLQKYEPDPSHIISYEPIVFEGNLTFAKEVIEILNGKE